MSGRKYTSITTTELRRLRNLAAESSRLRTSNRNLNELRTKNEALLDNYRNRINTMNQNMNRLNRQLENQRNSSKREVQQLQTQLQRAVVQSNAQIQQAAQRNERNLAAMQEGFQRELASTRSEFADAMESNNRRIEQAMNQNNQRIASELAQINGEITSAREQIQAIEATIESANQDEETLREMAREYVRTAQTLIEETISNYRPEVLLPGQLKPVQDLVQQAVRDIEEADRMHGGVAATARLTARQASAAALELYQNTLRAEQEWNLRYQVARQVVDAASAQAQSSRNLNISDEYGSASIDVNHWSDGDLNQLERRIGALTNCLDNAETMNIRQLESVQEAGAQVSREIEDTAFFATQAFYGSQDRADVAADIAQSMEQRLGLQIVGHSYSGQDQRSAHRLHLKNPATGFEMVVTQTPSQDENGIISNQLESDILNYGTCNEAEGDRIALGALQGLRDLGFNQQPVQTVSGFENRTSDRTECADMRRWEQEKNPEVLKPIHANRTN